MTSCLLSCTTKTTQWVYYKRKEIRSKFFPFRVDPFSKGGKRILVVTSLEKVSIPLNIITQVSEADEHDLGFHVSFNIN